MIEENYLLYQDDDYKIEVAGWFHKIAQEFGIKQFRIKREDCEPILYEVFSSMDKIGQSLSNVILAPNVPIIEYKKYVALNEPYDCFNDAVNLIATYNDVFQYKQEIIERIEHLSTNDITFYCDIFPKRVYEVAGYIVARLRDEDIVFLFGYENNKKEEDTNGSYF